MARKRRSKGRTPKPRGGADRYAPIDELRNRARLLGVDITHLGVKKKITALLDLRAAEARIAEKQQAREEANRPDPEPPAVEPPADLEAVAEGVVAKPATFPPAGPPPIFGVTIRPTAILAAESYDHPSDSGMPHGLTGPGMDLWNLAHRHPVQMVRIDELAVGFALEAGIGRWLDGADGFFARLKDLAGHPFGLAVLVRPQGAEPWIYFRQPYRHDGKPVVGELAILDQDADGAWDAVKWATTAPNSLRWQVEV